MKSKINISQISRSGIPVVWIITLLSALIISNWTIGADSGVKTKKVEGFGGIIAKKYEDSKEWWAEPVRAPEGAPNVLILLLDDVGFAQIGSFGGLIETPNIDRLAANGLRYNNFHTTALCSPSRATLMAGRYPHSIGLGSHALTAMGFPGYNAIVPETAKSVANYLQEKGYVNYALGKWDHTSLFLSCGMIIRLRNTGNRNIWTRIWQIEQLSGSRVTNPLNQVSHL